MHDLLEHNFQAEILNEKPGSNSSDLHYFSATCSNRIRDGIIVKVTSREQSSWVGIFEFGDWGDTGIYSMPDPQKLCAISRGVGYSVDSEKPTEWSLIPILPITKAFQIKERNLIIFNDFTDIYAWDKKGPLWQTESLASDDLEIKCIEKDLIIGKASKYGKPIEFTINVSNGTIISTK